MSAVPEHLCDMKHAFKIQLPDCALAFFLSIISDDPQELVEMMQKILQADEITKIQVLGKGKRKRIEMIFSESEDSDLDKEKVSFCLYVPYNC